MNKKGPSNDEYETPKWLLAALDMEFGFDFDAAANRTNAVCDRFSTNIDGSKKDLQAHPEWRVFCNPPYSDIDPFVNVMQHTQNTWVFLLPVRTGAPWFRVLRRMEKQGKAEIRFLRKRVQFLLNGKVPLNPKTGKPSGPRFDSMVVVVR